MSAQQQERLNVFLMGKVSPYLRKHADRMDWVCIVVFPKHIRNCDRFYRRSGPPLRELESGEVLRLMDHCALEAVRGGTIFGA
jgi:hypothetical protein